MGVFALEAQIVRRTKILREPWGFFSLVRQSRGQVPRVQGNTRTRHCQAGGIRPGIVDRNAVLTRRESTMRPTMVANMIFQRESWPE